MTTNITKHASPIVVIFILLAHVPTSHAARLDALILYQSSPQESAQFGRALATGDFDGDGYGDLVTAAPGYGTALFPEYGGLSVHYGSSGGLDGGSEWLNENDVVNSSIVAENQFGYAVVAGDFDGDGFDDLAVGIPFEDAGTHTNAGRVAVFFGGTNGLGNHGSEWFTQSSIAGEANESGDKLGHALASGDFDADGYDDLAVGIPGQDVLHGGSIRANAGVVAVLYGASTGLVPASTTVFTQADFSGAGVEANDRFGSVLATGDLDGDGYDDLAIGVPDESLDGHADAGAVGVAFGGTNGLTSAGTLFLDDSDVSNTIEDDEQFGAALATGDVDDDGIDDLVIGIPGPFTEDGRVQVFYGSSQFPTGTTESLSQWIFDGSTGAALGSSLAVGDLDGDGFDDIVAGMPYQGTPGAVSVWYGSATGASPGRDDWWEPRSFGDDGSTFEFGGTVAIDDFDGDGIAELASAAPLASVDFELMAGTVFVARLDPALPDIYGESAAVFDRTTGSFLGVKRVDELRAPASTTKIMWALVLADAIDDGLVTPFTIVTVTSDPLIDPNGDGRSDQDSAGNIGLEVGDRISVQDLAYATLLDSAGDAAWVMAEHLGGQAAYVSAMNAKAAALGLVDTNYVNVGGRDPNDMDDTRNCPDGQNDFDTPECAHYTTARDLARLADVALNDPRIATIVATPTHTSTTWRDSMGVSKDMMFTNSNRSFVNNYPGAYGVKTGTSNMAKQCFVGAATDGVDDLIALTMGFDSTTMTRFDEVELLMDYGFTVVP